MNPNVAGSNPAHAAISRRLLVAISIEYYRRGDRVKPIEEAAQV
jgi:hypothetical protein